MVKLFRLRIILVVLVLCIPLLGMAQSSQGWSGSGSGTESDPFRIFDPAELDQMRNFLNQEGVYFKLMDNIDLTNWINDNNPTEGWQPIGISTSPFKGTLDGNNKTISGLDIKRASTEYIGLFGYLNNATIKNLSIQGGEIVGSNYTGGLAGLANRSVINDVNLTISSIIGANYVGTIAGKAESTISISNCNITTIIDGVGSTSHGGLIGESNGTVSITNCVANVTVSGSRYIGGFVGDNIGILSVEESTHEGELSGNQSIGGLIGRSIGAISLTSTKHTGTVKSTESLTGGLIGECIQGTITKCSSEGDVTGTSFVGGLVGLKKDALSSIVINNSFALGNVTGTANVGGVVGRLESSINHAATDYKEYYSSYSLDLGDIVDNGSRVIVDCKYYSYHNGGSKYTLNGKSYSYKYLAIDKSSGITYKLSDYDYALHSTNAYSGYMIVAKFYYQTDNNGYYYNSYYGSASSGYKYKYLLIPFSSTESKNLITNSYFNGQIIGTENVGGIAGFAQTADITKNYSAALISGSTNVGGIVGKLDFGLFSNEEKSNLTSNVAINTSVNASISNAGRIFGENGTNWVIGTLGSSTTNKGLLTTSVSINGVAQKITDSPENGNTIGIATIKKKATYQGIGWEMTSDWNIQETESYPYKSWQTAPPIITGGATSGSTTITGKCIDTGTVYIEICGKNYTATASGNAWTATVDPLQAGTQLHVYAQSAEKAKSYSATSYVSFPGSGTADDPYHVITADDLAGINGNSYYKLMNDIDLTEWINKNSPTAGWLPIGRNSAVASYFDGDNHTISGLWTESIEDYTALFANASGATIKNLKVKIAEGKKVKGGNYTAGLLGRGVTTTIENCTVIGDVEGKEYVALLVGDIAGSVDGCHTKGSVVATDYVGGIVGQASAIINNSSSAGSVSCIGNEAYVGGIVGHSDKDISKCISQSDVTSSGANSKVGGIVGSTSSAIMMSTSSGKVTTSGSGSISGGIAGQGCNISDCYSQSDITGTAYVGGIAGNTYGQIERCYSAGNLEGTGWAAGISGYNIGSGAKVVNSLALCPKIEMTESNGTAKRVIGGYKDGAPDPLKADNYALKEMVLSLNGVAQSIYDNALNGIAKVDNEFKQSAFLSSLGWNFEDTWVLLELNSYPYLKMEKQNQIDKPDSGNEGGGNVGVVDYALSIVPVTTTAGESIDLSVNMKNKNDINGYQFDIVLPEGINVKKDTKGKYVFKKGARCDDHFFSSQLQPDGSIRVLCVSFTNSVFEGYEGEICQIPLEIAPSLINGDYKVVLKKVALSDTESTDIEASDVETDVKVINDYMALEDMNSTVGKAFYMPVNMINKTKDICSFQFDVNMPAGFDLAKDSEGNYIIELGDRGDDHVFSSLNRGNNVVRVVCTSLTNTPFTGNSGVLCKLKFVTSSDLSDGTYDINITNIAASNTSAQDIPMPDIKGSVTLKSFVRGDVNNDGKISVADATAATTFVLGNQLPSFIFEAADMDGSGEVKVNDVTAVIGLVLNDGLNTYTLSAKRMYAKARNAMVNKTQLYVEPFAIEPGEKKYINIMLDNPALVTIGWQTDIKLPEGISFCTNKRGKYITSVNEDRTSEYVISSALREEGKVRVVGVNMQNDPICETSGAIMSIQVQAAENLLAGIYNVELTHTSLSNERSEDIVLDDAVSSVLSGDLSKIKAMTLNGGWSKDAIAALNEKISTNDVITSVDMSSALAMESTANVMTANPNTLVYLPEEMALANDKNVVCGENCANLVITDGKPFGATKGFEASTALYSRSLTVQWGTVCLPFDLTSDMDIQYYVLSDISDVKMTFVPVSSVTAGTPAVFKVCSGSDMNISGSNVTVATSTNCWESIVAGENWKMQGSYSSFSLDPMADEYHDKNIYYLNGDKFLHANIAFPAGAFRGWFEAPKNSLNSKAFFMFGDDEVTNVNMIEKNNGNVEIIYDLSGRKLQKTKKGINIINNKKVIVK